MSLKEKPKKERVVYTSGRGGAGNIHKGASKTPADNYIPKQRKLLEVETARNRVTTMGRGGKGNAFSHCVEPGVFQRVLNYEAARIIAHKAEAAANKAYKEIERKRSKSITPSDDTVRPIRVPARLRSASTSTLSTYVTSSGSSAAPSNDPSSPRQSIRSAPRLSVTSRLFSHFKKRASSNSTDTPSIYSADNSSMHTIIISAPPDYQQSSPLDVMTSSTSIPPNLCDTSSSQGFISPKSNISYVQPPSSRYEALRAGQEVRLGLTPRYDNYSDIRTRPFTQSSTDVSFDMSFKSISDVRRARPCLDQDSNRSSHDFAEAQAQQFVAYHLPLRDIGHQSMVNPTSR